MRSRQFAVIVFGVCTLGSSTFALAGGVAGLRYHFKAVDSSATVLTPTRQIAVVLGDATVEADVRTTIAALGVAPTDITSSLLAGTLLVDAANVATNQARLQLAQQMLTMPGVDYVAPVSRTPSGVMLAMAPRVYVTRSAMRNTDSLPPAIDLTTSNGFEIEAQRLQIAATPGVDATTLGWFQVSSNAPRFIVPEPPTAVTRYMDGTRAMVPAETVWREMCGNTPGALSVEQLKRIADDSAQAAQAVAAAGAGQAGGSVAAVPGLDIQFSILSALPPGAADAIANVERYLETQFDDPITVVITLRFAPLGPGILGSTGSSYLSALYPTVRDALQADMDIDDTIQAFLPSGTTLAVRYNGNSEAITNESRVFVTRANYNAYIGAAGGSTASMTFSTNFSWDYAPPSITSGTFDFQSVLVHEVGHALGFTSGSDFRFNDMETLDLYRFQRSDGTGTNHNPDNLSDFQNEARTIDLNEPLPLDDANSDIISAEYRMSDGNPNQASHFHDQSPPIGIMDPTTAPGQTFFPNFFLQADSDMFDAIGWDFPSQNFCRQDQPLRDLTTLDGSRYIAFIPPFQEEPIAIRVKLLSLLNPFNGLPAGSPDLSPFEGQVRWVGAPSQFTDSSAQGTTFFAASTSCEPVCLDWSAFDVVHIYGGEITPDSIYSIQAIRCSCDINVEDDFSTALTVSTSHWGDVVEPFLSGIALIQPDLLDITSVVAKFLETPGAITKARTQLQPNVPDPALPVDFRDISADVGSFLDGVYALEGPCVCPSAVTCGATSCGMDTDCGTGLCIGGFCTDACGRCTP